MNIVEPLDLISEEELAWIKTAEDVLTEETVESITQYPIQYDYNVSEEENVRRLLLHYGVVLVKEVTTGVNKTKAVWNKTGQCIDRGD